MKRTIEFFVFVAISLTFCLGDESGMPLEGHRNGVAAVAVSPDGTRVATGGRDKLILVHPASGTASPQKLEGHKDAVTAVEFDAQGSVLASSAGKTVFLWRLADGKKSSPLEHSAEVVALAFSPDGSHLVTGNKNGGCAVWDVATVKPVRPLAGHARSVSSIVFFDDKYLLTAAAGDAVIKLCSIEAPAQTTPPAPPAPLTPFLPVLGHTKDGVNALAVGPGRRIVSGGADRAVVLWEVRGEGKDRRIEEAGRFTVERGELEFVAVGPDPGTVIGVAHKKLQQWDVKQQDGKQPKVWASVNFESSIAAGATNRDRTKFAFLTTDGKATLHTATELGLLVVDNASAASSSPLFKLPPLEVKHRWDEATTSGELRIAVSSRGAIGVTLDGGRGEIRNAADTSQSPVEFKHSAPLTAIAFTPDGGLVVGGGSDGVVTAFDVRTGQQAAKLEKHKAPVRAIAFTANGQRLVTGADDNLAHLWDADKGRVIGTFAGHTASVRAVAIDPQLTSIVTGSEDKTARVWEPAKFKTVQTLTEHTASVTAAIFSLDGQRLITGSEDKSIIVWKRGPSDDATQEEWIVERRIKDFTGAVTSLAMTPDGQSLLAGSREGALAEIDWNSGRITRVGVARALPDPKYATIKIRGAPPLPPPLPVNSVAVSPDGKLGVSTSGNATVVWTLK